jgi:hypothetical protein
VSSRPTFSKFCEGTNRLKETASSGFFRFSSTSHKQFPAVRRTASILMKATQLEMNFPVALGTVGKKQVAIEPPTFSSQFDWKRLEVALAELYPLGPVDRELWLRSGGDLSRLKLNLTGRTAWFSSLMYLRQGGGDSAFLKTLLSEALSDFPNHKSLSELASSL